MSSILEVIAEATQISEAIRTDPRIEDPEGFPFFVRYYGDNAGIVIVHKEERKPGGEHLVIAINPEEGFDIFSYSGANGEAPEDCSEQHVVEGISAREAAEISEMWRGRLGTRPTSWVEYFDNLAWSFHDQVPEGTKIDDEFLSEARFEDDIPVYIDTDWYDERARAAFAARLLKEGKDTRWQTTYR